MSSIAITLIPLQSKWDYMSIIWILLYTFSVICRGIYNVLQEKYFTETQDTSLYNNFLIAFYSRSVQFFVMILFFWLEYLIGYTNNPAQAFLDSGHDSFKYIIKFILLQGFVFSYISMFMLSLRLNSISTNYNMISSSIVGPITAIFFTIFQQFNTGIIYPLYITIPGLVLKITSSFLWIYGEKTKNEYTEVKNEV